MKPPKWTAEEDAKLRALYPDYSNRELATMLERSETAIKARGTRLNLRKREGWRKEPAVFSGFQIEQLKRLYPVMKNSEIALKIGLTEKQIANLTTRLGLHKPEGYVNSGCFLPGHTPFNKGMKQSEYTSPQGIENSSRTRFQKGQSPVNKKEIGSERIDSKDGYIYIKVRNDKNDVSNNYVLKHRHIWEQHHGPIPKGHVVVFKDGNRHNLDISNLELRSYAEHRARTVGEIPSEIKRLYQLKGALQRQINKHNCNGLGKEMD